MSITNQPNPIKPTLEPIYPPDPAPAPPPPPVPLSGTSYLALIASMVGIGFILSLIPCLVINTLLAGSLGAWLWVRREGTTPRLRLRRGLLAGMLAGLGGALVGSLFFLQDITQGDLSAILLGITAALVVFLLPSALGGLLTGLILSRHRRVTAAPATTTAPQPAPQAASLPALDRESLQSKMKFSAAQALARLPSSAAAVPTRGVVEAILSGPAFDFALAAALEKLPACMEARTPLSTAQVFNGCLVAVSVFPAWTPEQVRALLLEGYVSLVRELAAPYQEAESKVHVAHWVVASDGGLTNIYLTVIPNPQTAQAAPALIARELLSAEERAELGV